MTKEKNLKIVADGYVPMTRDEYFAESEDREVVTPENIGGLLEYPALFHAMQKDRELRPALNEAMSTGKALGDFLTLPPEKFLEAYVVMDGPTNPKTGKPYGTDTKAYAEWRATQEKTPVSTEQFNMFGKMAQAYNAHPFIKSLSGERCRNICLRADVGGVPCMCMVDSLYVNDDGIIAVSVKTTGDLCTFAKSADTMHYREQQALIKLILAAKGADVIHVAVAALERSPMPRCGVFLPEKGSWPESQVQHALESYAKSCETGVFGTTFEDVQLI